MSVDVKIIKEFLSQDTLVALHQLVRDGRQPSAVSFFSYQTDSVIGASNAIFAFSIEAELREQIAAELIAKKVWGSVPKDWRAHVNLFPRGAFIPWHNDSNYVHTTTVYLNERWDYDWGGAFLYSLEEPPFENVNCVYPERNKAVVFAPPLHHTTTLTAINAPMRESLQIFVKEF